MSYSDFLATALEAARKAGPVIKAAFLNRTLQGTLDLKSNTSDLVTATDKAVEALVFAHIREKYPDHKFIGEETYDGATTELTNDLTWCVDPVDGTTNFVHGFPYVCISIALLKNAQAVVGVVLNPILGECFYAAEGSGAFMEAMDGTVHSLPLYGVQPWKGLSASLVATEWGYERDARLDSKLKTLDSVLKAPTRGVRSLGSAALEACYVARGTFDLYWEAGVHMWDVAAAAIIIRESGGEIANFVVVRDESGKEVLDLKQRKFLFVRAVEGVLRR
ncbi:inositol monophosphatase [Rhizoclosmatium globosum]|uniref:Inositol-1-monophosphatase n=1 Tax=Rhizoclosmatium globosum TaxID=329046 RepID=A0A1Y2CDK3_9FUNG|nr:inositol monophosphatase [Rhizoclosmatium globosum]|eukprot:ORY45140.1 inositol monophosphatase [Rhizoclosmatium globosum]